MEGLSKERRYKEKQNGNFRPKNYNNQSKITKHYCQQGSKWDRGKNQ